MNKLKALLLSVLLLSSMTFAQQDVGRQVAYPWQTYYTPTAAGINALVLPATPTVSGTSAFISTIGAKQVSIIGQCTQGPTVLRLQQIAEDGTTVLTDLPVLTAIAANTAFDFHFASELGPNISGTGTLNNANSPFLPFRGFTLSFANGSATPGTCTARVILAY